ncbi:hypothetical protein EDB51_13217 [Vibrio crassostreae]|nr:hypothetical protein EDB51_13217 [Vibrio crassostreae]
MTSDQLLEKALYSSAFSITSSFKSSFSAFIRSDPQFMDMTLIYGRGFK